MTTDRDFDSTAYGRGYKDGKRDAAAEITRLRERLEIDPSHPYDGIYCRDETIRLQDAEIARLKSELLQRDMTWLPAKDAEIARLKAEIASKERQFQDYVTRMTPDGLEWLICDEPCKAMDARSGCHCAKARDEITRLKAEVERLREELNARCPIDAMDRGMSIVEAAIYHVWGERCPDFEPGCLTCNAWAEFDQIERLRAALKEKP